MSLVRTYDKEEYGQGGALTIILGPFPNNIINWNKMIYVCYNSSNDLRKFGFCRKYFKYSKFSTIMSLGSASSMVKCLTAMWGIAGSSPGRCLNAFLQKNADFFMIFVIYSRFGARTLLGGKLIKFKSGGPLLTTFDPKHIKRHQKKNLGNICPKNFSCFISVVYVALGP